MGNLLGSPITEKETHQGESGDLKFGVSSMQGWRVHMEDAHIMESNLYCVSSANNQKLNLPEGHALFAVFDGHGGTFAAEYCGANFCRIFSKQPGVMEYLEHYKSNKEREEAIANGVSPPETAVEKLKDIQTCKAPLEKALQQAFLELDQELARMVQGDPVKDANSPYHPPASASSPTDENSSQSSSSSNQQPATSNTEADMLKAATAAAAQHAQVLSDGGDDSGTTACLVLVTPQWLICANAGDSRAVFSKKQRAVPLSYDHKPDDEAEERRIRSAGGYVAGGRVEGDLAVSRGLGDFRFKTLSTVLEANVATASNQKVSPVPDLIVQTRNATADDFLIIACDGIWDVMTNQECVTEVHELFKEGETDMGLVCEELLDVCLQKGSKDNMTAIVVAFPPAMKVANDVVAEAASSKTDKSNIGVLGRRKRRDEEHDTENNTTIKEEEDDEEEEEEEGEDEKTSSSDEKEDGDEKTAETAASTDTEGDTAMKETS